MTLEENLTNLQKVALKGEIAYAVSTCAHNTDIKYRLYLILKEVEEKDRPFVLQAFKESVTFNEEILDRIYLETLSGKVPVWLWVEKAIADMTESINLSDLTGIHLSINKKIERKRLVESAFIRFARETLLVSPSSANELFKAILEEDKLSFLHTSCYYLKDCYNEIKEKNFIKEQEVPEELMEITFDIREVLCYRVETEALEELNKNPLKKRQPLKENFTSSVKRRVQKQPVQQEIIRIEGSISPSELSDYISQKITELFQGDSTDITTSSSVQASKEPKISYVVQKVFNNTNIKTDIKECSTAEEAQEFIEKVKKEYPELQATCDFIICKKRSK